MLIGSLDVPFCTTSAFRINEALIHLAYRYCTTLLFQIIRVSPMIGVVRFSWSGRLVPRYIGPFPITERIGFLAYRLLLPAQFSVIHDVFHASSFYGNALGIPILFLSPVLLKKLKFHQI